MEPVTALGAITGVYGLFHKLYSLGESLYNAPQDFDTFQTWCCIHKLQLTMIRKWAHENHEALEKVGRDTQKLLKKVLKNIGTILGSLEKLLTSNSRGGFKSRVRTVYNGSEAMKAIHTLEGLLLSVRSTIEFLESTKGTRDPAKANRKASQSFDANLWDALELTPTKELDLFVQNVRDDLNKTTLNGNGERVIHIASRLGNLPILDSLLRHKIETDVTNVHKQTPIHLALLHGQKESVEKLIKQSIPSLYMQDDEGRSPLHLALHFRFEDIAVKLIRKRRDTLSLPDYTGKLPLHVAATQCLSDATKEILQQSDDTFKVDQPDEFGKTAMTMALNPQSSDQDIFQKQKETIKYLSWYGADVKQRVFPSALNSLLVFHDLARQGRHDILDEIPIPWQEIVNLPREPHWDGDTSRSSPVRAPTGATPLYLAAAAGKLGTVKFFLQKGANPNIELAAPYSSPDPPTPLWVALENSNTDVIKELLEQNAETNVEWNGTHMLHRAIEKSSAKCRPQVVKHLLSHDADLHRKDKDGMKPMICAARKGCVTSLNTLWDAHERNETPETDAKDALIKACQEGHPSCVTVLYAKGVDINLKTQDGYTPLHYAARYGRRDVVNVLLPMGADHTHVAPIRQEPFEVAGTAEAVARASGHAGTAGLIKNWGLLM